MTVNSTKIDFNRKWNIFTTMMNLTLAYGCGRAPGEDDFYF